MAGAGAYGGMVPPRAYTVRELARIMGGSPDWALFPAPLLPALPALPALPYSEREALAKGG
jgi:hypothetical protein